MADFGIEPPKRVEGVVASPLRQGEWFDVELEDGSLLACRLGKRLSDMGMPVTLGARAVVLTGDAKLGHRPTAIYIGPAK
jgi:hypothetical protein